MSTPPGPPFYTTALPTTTTKKHATFLSTPLQDSGLLDVPGVGEVAGARLADAGVDSAEQLVGHFLVGRRCPAAMTRWLLGAGVRAQEAGKIVGAVERKARMVVTI
jgi:hypothetical protein